ncbi:PREDICTED: polyamine oxidase-like [Amphimedon queenslandica]|uniref:Amine oxidase domain-containing protein n=1 Tax=Amphimedon queenslandica TaxID=400682 RepID=A0A1X7TSX5_AMPQE|nr:PREDICTED: polyamine oxidase-like [Amphimedon queenslandica]|eukprot:XP_011406886.1 PREDICTED: polyamine oxidase-like [Amphimedon queenslandica]
MKMFSIALLFLVAEGVVSLECPAQKDAEVLILGAGMAGITAARTLHDSGITNIKILEANSKRIGGRMRNVSFMGVQVETGAYWIHEMPENPQTIGGPGVNPIWTLARDPSKCFAEVLKGNYTGESEYMDTNSTGNYNVVNAEPVIEEYNEIFFDKIFENDSDISVRDALRYEGWNPDTLLKQLVEWDKFDYSYATTTDRSSLPLLIAEYDQYKFEGESDFRVTDQRGYVSIVHCIAEPFSNKIELGAVVTSIDWNDECFCADVAGQGRVCGDYGITTFSIGVLQNFLENGRFNGTLSSRKIAAIENSRMGLYFPILVSFPSSFWNTETDYILRTDTRYGYYHALEPIGRGLPGSPAMCTVPLTGDEAKRVSSLTKNEIYNEIMDVMHLWYGSNIPNATDIEYYDWYNDEFYRGMFSNIPLNLTLEEKENLAVPEGRLYFSGEGVIVYSTGTVHAAYCSGIDSATDILEKKGLSERSTFLPKCEDGTTMPPSQTPSPTPTTTAPPSSAYSVGSTSLISLIIALFVASLFAAFH